MEEWKGGRMGVFGFPCFLNRGLRGLIRFVSLKILQKYSLITLYIDLKMSSNVSD